MVQWVKDPTEVAWVLWRHKFNPQLGAVGHGSNVTEAMAYVAAVAHIPSLACELLHSMSVAKKKKRMWYVYI